MALTPEQRGELDELLFALRDGALDGDGHARLERLVLEHDEARERFVAAMHLQAALHWRYAERDTNEPLPVVVAAQRKPAGTKRKLPTRWLALAASLLAIAVGATALVWNRNSGEVARVTKMTDVRWQATKGSSAPIKVGAELPAGTRLDLASGAVELMFTSGTRVILAGPTQFEVISPLRGKLAAGMVTAKAPPHLKGFTVETPSLTVVDLGTEFGVRTSQSGQSEVHVFDGLVEAAATKNASKKIRLTERQAIRCDEKTGTLDDVLFDDEHFVRDADKKPPAPVSVASFAEPFDALDHLKPQAGYKCTKVKTALAADHHEGSAAVEINWQAAADSYGVVYLSKKVAPTDITGCSFEVWVKPLTKNSGYWGIELRDHRGELVERHHAFDLKTATWNQLVFRQGQKRGPSSFFQAGPGDRRRVSKVVFRAQTHQSGLSARDLWDDFKLIRKE